jgi:transposase
MQTALENLSKNELIKLARQQLAGQKSFEALEHKAQMQEAEIERLTQERDYLKAQVEMFQRMQFGRGGGPPEARAFPG